MRTPLFLVLLCSMLTGCSKKTDSSSNPGDDSAPRQAGTATTPRRISIDVTDDGFVPHQIAVKQGVPLTLAITRQVEQTCATEITIEGTDIRTELPLQKAVEVAYTPTHSGRIKFGCAMDKMVGGVLVVN